MDLNEFARQKKARAKTEKMPIAKRGTGGNFDGYMMNTIIVIVGLVVIGIVVKYVIPIAQAAIQTGLTDVMTR